MLTRALLNQIVANDALVRGLHDPEARVLIEWLVDRAEERAPPAGHEEADAVVRDLCRRGQAIRRFVTLWCYDGLRGAAHQLAAAERFAWPLPDGPTDPCSLMQNILVWEERATRGRKSSGSE